jgi:hypothetical protein
MTNLEKQIIPILTPLLALLKSRKVIVALAVLIAFFITNAIPSLAPQEGIIAGLLFGIGGLVIGTIAWEDVSVNLGPIATTPKAAIEAALLDILRTDLPPGLAALVTPELVDVLVSALWARLFPTTPVPPATNTLLVDTKPLPPAMGAAVNVRAAYPEPQIITGARYDGKPLPTEANPYPGVDMPDAVG